MTPENVKAFRLRALIKSGGPEAVAAELRKIVRQTKTTQGKQTSHQGASQISPARRQRPVCIADRS